MFIGCCVWLSFVGLLGFVTTFAALFAVGLYQFIPDPWDVVAYYATGIACWASIGIGLIGAALGLAYGTTVQRISVMIPGGILAFMLFKIVARLM